MLTPDFFVIHTTQLIGYFNNMESFLLALEFWYYHHFILLMQSNSLLVFGSNNKQ